jgi:hypothetical protein
MTVGDELALVRIILAGPAAARRCQRPDAEGWRRHRSVHERICFHESGHAIVAAMEGWFPQWAIAKAPMVAGDGITCAGRMCLGQTPTEGAGTTPTVEGNDAIPSDLTKAMWFGWKMTGGGAGWLRYMRGLWLETDAILEASWPAVKVLAMALQQDGVVKGPDIADILRRFGRKGDAWSLSVKI